VFKKGGGSIFFGGASLSPSPLFFFPFFHTPTKPFISLQTMSFQKEDTKILRACRALSDAHVDPQAFSSPEVCEAWVKKALLSLWKFLVVFTSMPLMTPAEADHHKKDLPTKIGQYLIKLDPLTGDSLHSKKGRAYCKTHKGWMKSEYIHHPKCTLCVWYEDQAYKKHSRWPKPTRNTQELPLQPLLQGLYVMDWKEIHEAPFPQREYIVKQTLKLINSVNPGLKSTGQELESTPLPTQIISRATEILEKRRAPPSSFS
jgi:hypothetical protein